MSKEPLEYIRHNADECNYLLSVGKDVEEATFMNNETVKRAVVRILEISGEAAMIVPSDFKIHWPNVQWKNMAGMRDRLIRDYFGVNYTIVWDVIKNKILALSAQMQEIIKAI